MESFSTLDPLLTQESLPGQGDAPAQAKGPEARGHRRGGLSRSAEARRQIVSPERARARRHLARGARAEARGALDVPLKEALLHTQQAELTDRRTACAVAPRLLVIDDDDDLLQMAKEILGADGYLVDTAYAALDGVHKALRFPPDVILLDVLMSGCDGLEIFDTLRQHERTCNVPVLALSSLAGRDASRLLLDIGFAALIEKPVDWPVLRHELRRRVNSRAI